MHQREFVSRVLKTLENSLMTVPKAFLLLHRSPFQNHVLSKSSSHTHTHRQSKQEQRSQIHIYTHTHTHTHTHTYSSGLWVYKILEKTFSRSAVFHYLNIISLCFSLTNTPVMHKHPHARTHTHTRKRDPVSHTHTHT